MKVFSRFSKTLFILANLVPLWVYGSEAKSDFIFLMEDTTRTFGVRTNTGVVGISSTRSPDMIKKELSDLFKKLSRLPTYEEIKEAVKSIAEEDEQLWSEDFLLPKPPPPPSW